MGICKYCAKPAGFFRYTHKECAKSYDEGRNEILARSIQAITNNDSLDLLDNEVKDISDKSYIDKNLQHKLILSAWEKAVDLFLDDGILDEEEEKRLLRYKDYYLLNNDELDGNGYLTKTVKAAVLKDILNGTIPSRMSVDGGISLNLQKNEKIIWAFPETEYLEDKTRRQYVGRSQGVSVRIMKGVYYRTGSFRGNPVEYTERVSMGKGLMVLTTKHIYFHGLKSFRIPYQKIVSFEPFSNGVTITRDAANAKSQSFINGDGWFTYNVLSNISNL